METFVRYKVINQDGKPVIRAVPVRSWADERAAQRPAPVTVAQEQPVLRKIRRFRMLDIR